jgi:deazaflavin-dependent oxidoreductase (nitroreductase family)
MRSREQAEGRQTVYAVKAEKGIPAMTTSNEPRYVRPGRSTSVFNEAVAAMTRAGISIWGSRILAVRGRKSGEWRTTPVNPLTLNGERYLVAPRGETQWVRNMRAAGGGELRVGRRAEPFTATELADADKPRVLRAYLKRWKFEVGVFFDGVGADAPEAKLLEIAPGYPVFRINQPA